MRARHDSTLDAGAEPDARTMVAATRAAVAPGAARAFPPHRHALRARGRTPERRRRAAYGRVGPPRPPARLRAATDAAAGVGTDRGSGVQRPARRRQPSPGS